MNSIIKEMYYGRQIPFDELQIETKEYNRQVEKLIKAEEELLKSFPECRELLSRCSDAHAELSEMANYRQFLHGFKTGAQIMMEMLSPMEK